MDGNSGMSNECNAEPEIQSLEIIDLTNKPPSISPRHEKRKRAKAKKVTGQRNKSDVWLHFTKIEGDTSKAMCNYYEAIYEADTSTSSMWNHLLRPKTGYPSYPYRQLNDGKG